VKDRQTYTHTDTDCCDQYTFASATPRKTYPVASPDVGLGVKPAAYSIKLVSVLPKTSHNHNLTNTTIQLDLCKWIPLTCLSGYYLSGAIQIACTI